MNAKKRTKPSTNGQSIATKTQCISLLFVSLLYIPSAKEANVYKLYVAFPLGLSFITFPFAFAFSAFSVSFYTVGF